jgi:putative FmdB family regulatory protein
MPIYEYLCQDCGQKFDTMRPFIEADNPVDCEKCKSMNTKRTLSLFYARNERGSVSGISSGCNNCKSGSCNGCSK